MEGEETKVGLNDKTRFSKTGQDYSIMFGDSPLGDDVSE